MQTDETSAAWDQTKFDRYKLIRDEIVHEDNLMSNRLNWFTASQSFLLTALAIAHQGDTAMPTRTNDYLFPLVPLVAICSCLLILAGIVAGLAALRRWRSLLATTVAGADFLPRIASDKSIVVLGWSAPVLLPIIFLAAWGYLLFRGLGYITA